MEFAAGQASNRTPADCAPVSGDGGTQTGSSLLLSSPNASSRLWQTSLNSSKAKGISLVTSAGIWQSFACPRIDLFCCISDWYIFKNLLLDKSGVHDWGFRWLGKGLAEAKNSTKRGDNNADSTKHYQATEARCVSQQNDVVDPAVKSNTNNGQAHNDGNELDYRETLLLAHVRSLKVVEGKGLGLWLWVSLDVDDAAFNTISTKRLITKEVVNDFGAKGVETVAFVKIATSASINAKLLHISHAVGKGHGLHGLVFLAVNDCKQAASNNNKQCIKAGEVLLLLKSHQGKCVADNSKANEKLFHRSPRWVGVAGVLPGTTNS